MKPRIENNLDAIWLWKWGNQCMSVIWLWQTGTSVCPHTAFLNTLRPRQNGCHFADDTFKCIFLNENVRISIKISLKFVPMGPINNIPALVQTMAWCRPGDKPLSEPMMVRSPMHICITQPQWVKTEYKYEGLWNLASDWLAAQHDVGKYLSRKMDFNTDFSL